MLVVWNTYRTTNLRYLNYPLYCIRGYLYFIYFFFQWYFFTQILLISPCYYLQTCVEYHENVTLPPAVSFIIKSPVVGSHGIQTKRKITEFPHTNIFTSDQELDSIQTNRLNSTQLFETCFKHKKRTNFGPFGILYFQFRRLHQEKITLGRNLYINPLLFAPKTIFFSKRFKFMLLKVIHYSFAQKLIKK